MAKQPKKQAVKPEMSKQAVAKAKYHAAKSAKRAAKATAPVTEAAPPPAPATVKPKKTRYVREKKAAPAPPPTSVGLPPRSKRPTAKLLTKGLALPPKEDKTTGPMPMG